MCKRLIVSTLFGLSFLVLTASGQQPGNPQQNSPALVYPSGWQQQYDPQSKAKEAPATPALGTQPKSGKKTDPVDALVIAALAHDPDVKVAQAKVQLAEAELAKAKQAVILKVMTLNATIKELNSRTAALTESVQIAEQLVKTGAAPLSQLVEERTKLEQAKAAHTKAELELKLITGGLQKESFTTTGVPLNTAYPTWDTALHYWNPNTAFYGIYNNPNMQNYSQWTHTTYDVLAAKGPIPDRIRAALDKPVKLGAKGEQVTFAKALEIFKKEAGLDVPVRETAKVQPVSSEGEELPVGAWFQLFADNNPSSRFLVREYGLLVTLKDVAPPDALPVIEFWKMPVKKSDPEPKAKEQNKPAGGR